MKVTTPTPGVDDSEGSGVAGVAAPLTGLGPHVEPGPGGPRPGLPTHGTPAPPGPPGTTPRALHVGPPARPDPEARPDDPSVTPPPGGLSAGPLEVLRQQTRLPPTPHGLFLEKGPFDVRRHRSLTSAPTPTPGLAGRD